MRQRCPTTRTPDDAGGLLGVASSRAQCWRTGVSGAGMAHVMPSAAALLLETHLFRRARSGRGEHRDGGVGHAALGVSLVLLPRRAAALSWTASVDHLAKARDEPVRDRPMSGAGRRPSLPNESAGARRWAEPGCPDEEGTAGRGDHVVGACWSRPRPARRPLVDQGADRFFLSWRSPGVGWCSRSRSGTAASSRRPRCEAPIPWPAAGRSGSFFAIAHANSSPPSLGARPCRHDLFVDVAQPVPRPPAIMSPRKSMRRALDGPRSRAPCWPRRGDRR